MLVDRDIDGHRNISKKQKKFLENVVKWWLVQKQRNILKKAKNVDWKNNKN